MRKQFFSILYILILGSTVKGQDIFYPELSFGIKGGISHSNMFFDPDMETKAIDIPGWGVFISYLSEPHVGIQLGMNSVNYGWKEKSDTLGEYVRAMNYLEFPFLTHIVLGKKNVKFNFDIGPYVSFYQGMTEDYDPTLRINNPADTIILGERNYYGIAPEKNLDYGFLVGTGIGYNTKFGLLALDIRFTQGAVNIMKKFPKGNFKYSTCQSYFMSVSYSYVFKLPARKKQFKLKQKN